MGSGGTDFNSFIATDKTSWQAEATNPLLNDNLLHAFEPARKQEVDNSKTIKALPELSFFSKPAQVAEPIEPIRNLQEIMAANNALKEVARENTGAGRMAAMTNREKFAEVSWSTASRAEFADTIYRETQNYREGFLTAKPLKELESVINALDKSLSRFIAASSDAQKQEAFNDIRQTVRYLEKSPYVQNERTRNFHSLRQRTDYINLRTKDY